MEDCTEVKINNTSRIFHNLLSILSSFDDVQQCPHMKADSGATKTYLKPAHMTYLKKVTKLLDPQDIYLPDNTSLTPTHTGVLDLHPSLPDEAQQARVVLRPVGMDANPEHMCV